MDPMMHLRYGRLVGVFLAATLAAAACSRGEAEAPAAGGGRGAGGGSAGGGTAAGGRGRGPRGAPRGAPPPRVAAVVARGGPCRSRRRRPSRRTCRLSYR